MVAAAIDLFVEHGYDQTSVEQIAQAAGVSRSTFFRQFGGKEDVVFADHEVLLAETRAYLAQHHDDPWAAVCEASVRVFRHFAADPELARRRYVIVREIPGLRDREIVTVFRYERLFDEYLRGALPGLDPLDAVGFAALVTAVHNHVLRRLMRGPGCRHPSCAALSTTCCAATACTPTATTRPATTSSSRPSPAHARRRGDAALARVARRLTRASSGGRPGVVA